MLDTSMLQIVLENTFFMVVTKPCGISVHNDQTSVAEWLTAQKKPLHFVNRLDRETSGLMLVAHKPEFHEPLRQAIDEGQKIYRALLCGGWKKPNETKQQWSWPLTDQAEGYKNVQGDRAGQKDCHSVVELQRSTTFFSEVLVEIKTGRQHQIRRHAVLHGQAIVGDNRYGNEKHNHKLGQIYKQSPLRLQLHAETLKFRFDNQQYDLHDPNFSLEQFF